MEILKYASGQYAGMLDQEISFRSGMNVVLGDNETGKSTMITGLYDTLMTRSKIDGRKDRYFVDSRFPTNGGNSIDGEVRLTVGGQKVTVKKEWTKGNSGPRTVLVTESEGRFTGAEAESRIRELLSYGAGIYDHIVFGRQNNESAILDWYFDFMAGNPDKAAGEDVSRARKKISEAFSAVSGISEEEYERRLDEKLDGLGSHWDFSRQAPEGGRGLRNPWAKKVGRILQAYYALEGKRQEAAQAQEAFQAYSQMKARLGQLQQQREELEGKARELQTQESSAALMSSRQSLERDIKRLEQALQAWPALNQELALLTALKQEGDEQQNRARKKELIQNLEKVRALNGQRAELLKIVEPLKSVEQDAKECRRMLADGERFQAAMGSGRLHASIAMHGGYTARLTGANGETVEVAAALEQDVDGFAKIDIPGVGEITVAPQDLDIPALERQIKSCHTAAGEIMAKYGVSELAALEKKEDIFRGAMKNLDRLDADLARIPGHDDPDGLEQAVSDIVVHDGMPMREDLDSAVRAALQDRRERTMPERIAVVESVLRGYERDYASISNLAEQAEKQRKELDELSSKLRGLPPLTLSVEEFNRQKREISIRLNGENGNAGIVKEIEKLIGDLSLKEKAVDDINLDEIEADTRELEQDFERSQKLYAQYSRIKEDFQRLKKEQGDQFTAFYDRFNEYLDIVTGGQVRLEEGSTLKSGSHSLAAKELLSRGTKQTVLLAFRLALLRFYYQDEPGVIVLDDTLLDMDPGRRRNSAALLREFAKDNQVIFTTCDPAVADMLGGNLVELGK